MYGLPGRLCYPVPESYRVAITFANMYQYNIINRC